MPDLAKSVWTTRYIDHTEALEIARRLINSHFNHEPRARVGIPARPDYDDDLLITAYIDQQAGQPAPALVHERDALKARVAELEALINSPETDDWLKGVELEAAHQIEWWGEKHDACKTAFDWFWLIGYLSQKAATSAVTGDVTKAKHHMISTAAVLLQWHRRITGENTLIRPGLAEPQEAAANG